jgi:ligand-binding SRPBCC domain-containing protein
MPTIIVETIIQTSIERCFDLARDIGLHCETVAYTNERAVAGITSGLISLGQSVTFEATHLGIRQRLSSRIVEFERPHLFVDEMIKGAFASMKHIHEFTVIENGTLMRDTLMWASPLGILGRIADRIVIERHMRNFLLRRNAKLKEVAELK